MDILLEDGTVWDGKDPEEPFLCHRLKFCQACQSIMASPERMKDLSTYREKSTCSGSAEGGPMCSAEAMAMLAEAEYQKKTKERKPIESGDNQAIEGPLVKSAGFTFTFRPFHRPGDKNRYDIYKLQLNMRLAFNVYALLDDPAAQYVTARPFMRDLAQGAGQQILSWISVCCNEHAECPSPRENPLPTRVVDVETGLGPNFIRVYETRGEIGKYIALSYCWGGRQPVRLATDTYEQMIQPAGIELSTLPLTLQDAVHVTRDMGLKYLWIDALCIIQDSWDDMEGEIKAMASTYKNAYVTIAAASAETCQDGFLQYRVPRKSKFPRFELPYRAWDDTPSTPAGRIIAEESIMYNPLLEPISRRAWCLQEKLLSPRIATFGMHELIFQCRDEGYGDPLVAGSNGRLPSFMRGSERLCPAFFNSAGTISPGEFFNSWTDVLIDYSCREVTYKADTLVALSALASEFQRLSNGDEYLAGLWRRELIKWLCWIVDPSPELDPQKLGQKLQPRLLGVVPSWSWASANGIITIDSRLEDKDFHAEVVRCETTLLDERLPTGAVTAGVLELRGRLKEARWSGHTLFEAGGVEIRPVCLAFMDADEDKPDLVFCIRIQSRTGLVLAANDSSSYRRVGYFQFHKSYLGGELTGGWCDCEEWFAGCELQNIIIK